MAVKLRLTRVGSKKNPIYRVVAADSRSPRDGKFIEIVGRYNPQSDPSLIDLDEEKVRGWLEKGAQPTESVATSSRAGRSRARRSSGCARSATASSGYAATPTASCTRARRGWRRRERSTRPARR